jgi:hypothetical protein
MGAVVKAKVRARARQVQVRAEGVAKLLNEPACRVDTREGREGRAARLDPVHVFNSTVARITTAGQVRRLPARLEPQCLPRPECRF